MSTNRTEAPVPSFSGGPSHELPPLRTSLMHVKSTSSNVATAFSKKKVNESRREAPVPAFQKRSWGPPVKAPINEESVHTLGDLYNFAGAAPVSEDPDDEEEDEFDDVEDECAMPTGVRVVQEDSEIARKGPSLAAMALRKKA